MPLNTLLEQFDEKFPCSPECNQAKKDCEHLGLSLSCLCLSKKKEKDFIIHVYKTAVEEAKRVAIESVPNKKPVFVNEAGFDENPDWNDCRSQTLTNIESEFKKLV